MLLLVLPKFPPPMPTLLLLLLALLPLPLGELHPPHEPHMAVGAGVGVAGLGGPMTEKKRENQSGYHTPSTAAVQVWIV
jgi:hypothetical protein